MLLLPRRWCLLIEQELVVVDTEFLWNEHVDVVRNLGLRISEYEVDLACVPAVDKGQDEEYADGSPGNDRCKGVLEVHALDGLASMGT